MSTAQKLTVTKRPWNDRGFADHGWLYTFHTFSFASYYDPKALGYGPLQVINEDRVAKGRGFGKHRHSEALIWSYIVSGELQHKDSMGNEETLSRGDVQFTSAGTGIAHSEHNDNKSDDNHFLQIWAKPDVQRLAPSYITRRFTDDQKRNVLLRIMESNKRHDGRDGESDPIPLHADLSMDASILDPGKTVTHSAVAPGNRKLYVHVVMSDKKQVIDGARLKVGDIELGEGDGAYIDGLAEEGTLELQSIGSKPAEILLFDMGP